jgi:hypothetical protein
MIVSKATIHLAFLRSPWIMPDGQRVYLVEFTTDRDFPGVWRNPADGAYTAFSRTQPPVLNKRRDAIHLAAELADGSIANLDVRRHGVGLMLEAVQLIKHVIIKGKAF